MTPAQTLATARHLLQRPSARTTGPWPRAAALLARQALEQAVDDFWRARSPGLDRLPMRPQLLCLSSYLPTEGVAARVTHTWSSLSSVCHHHPYELSPSASELLAWIDAVDEALAAMAAAAAGAR
jgi:hypothetical protein